MWTVTQRSIIQFEQHQLLYSFDIRSVFLNLKRSPHFPVQTHGPPKGYITRRLQRQPLNEAQPVRWPLRYHVR